MMMKKFLAAAAAVTLMAGVAGYTEKAEAAIVSFWDDGFDDVASSTGQRYDVGCFSDAAKTMMVGCFGALIDVSLNTFDTNGANGLNGDQTDLGNGINPAAEIAFVQGYVGDAALDWTSGVAGTTDAGGAGATTFLSGAQYILFTIGKQPRVGLLRNDSGAPIYVDFAQIAGTGSGLSHYAEFGGTVVPVPAAAWLFLTGLAGLFGFRRFKSRAAA